MKGDEYRDNGTWKPVSADDIGSQIMFTKYTEVRRPSEEPFKAISPDNVATAKAAPNVAKAEKVITPVPTPSGTGETHQRTVADLKRILEHPSTVIVETDAAKKTGLLTAIKKTLRETPETVNEERTEVAKSPASPTLPTHASVTWDTDKEPSCRWIGRNGTFQCRGVNIELRKGISPSKDVIAVLPVGKRGEAKNAEIEFPVNAIPQIIDFLKQTYDNTKTTTVS